MNTLTFGNYELLDEHCLEIIASEGTELDIKEAEECLALYAQLNRPLGLLINRKHSYSSSLEFVMMVAQAPQVKAFAILVESERSDMVADSQKLFFNIPFEVFYDRDTARNWLKQNTLQYT